MIIISMLISLSMFLCVPVIAQTEVPGNSFRSDSNKKQMSLELQERKDSLLLSRLGNTRIILKDGSIKKNCNVKEINEYWIVFEKEGSLHDQLIEKIRRIEIEDGRMQAVFFDENNKSMIRAINWKN